MAIVVEGIRITHLKTLFWPLAVMNGSASIIKRMVMESHYFSPLIAPLVFIIYYH